MRLHGVNIADISGDGEFQYTTMLAGITEMGLKPRAVRLAIHLFEVMSYPDPADKNKITAPYKSEFEFADKRIKWKWERTQFSKAKKELIEAGLIRVFDGDWYMDISVIPRHQLTSKRRQAADVVTEKLTLDKAIKKQATVEIAHNKQPKQALPVSTLEVFVTDTEPAPVEQMVEVSTATIVPEQKAIDEGSLDPEYLDYTQRAEAAGCNVSHYLTWSYGKEHLMANLQQVEARVRANIAARKTSATESTEKIAPNPPLESSFEAYERKRQEEIAQWAAGNWDDQTASSEDDELF